MRKSRNALEIHSRRFVGGIECVGSTVVLQRTHIIVPKFQQSPQKIEGFRPGGVKPDGLSDMLLRRREAPLLNTSLTPFDVRVVPLKSRRLETRARKNSIDQIAYLLG